MHDDNSLDVSKMPKISNLSPRSTAHNGLGSVRSVLVHVFNVESTAMLELDCVVVVL